MSDKLIVNHYQFTNKDIYEQAVMEQKVIMSMRKKFNLMDGKIASKVYVKAIEENVFTTIVGYAFLDELRNTAIIKGKISADKLPVIPVKNGDTVVVQESRPTGIRSADPSRYKRMYDGQRLLNKRLKVILFAIFVVVAAVFIIDFRSEYSIFTYFTDYKAKMEEELIDKYESWEKDLKAREDALNQNQ